MKTARCWPKTKIKTGKKLVIKDPGENNTISFNLFNNYQILVCQMGTKWGKYKDKLKNPQGAFKLVQDTDTKRLSWVSARAELVQKLSWQRGTHKDCLEGSRIASWREKPQWTGGSERKWHHHKGQGRCFQNNSSGLQVLPVQPALIIHRWSSL